ncbi:hypothetical protein O181_022055 [Austropuccinia psidii MF-1]|uniref:WD40 repeat-containing protein n=1 Tax=Austropuccinia psidii MF-1 TaxID=1389203 RepID=A0A9Q3CGQ6_9BASI|nr:hypothetical protein [Austropuccinia psidii MF-1]
METHEDLNIYFHLPKIQNLRNQNQSKSPPHQFFNINQEPNYLSIEGQDENSFPKNRLTFLNHNNQDQITFLTIKNQLIILRYQNQSKISTSSRPSTLASISIKNLSIKSSISSILTNQSKSLNKNLKINNSLKFNNNLSNKSIPTISISISNDQKKLVNNNNNNNNQIEGLNSNKLNFNQSLNQQNHSNKKLNNNPSINSIDFNQINELNNALSVHSVIQLNLLSSDSIIFIQTFSNHHINHNDHDDDSATATAADDDDNYFGLILTKFGKCSKISLIDGHIIDSVQINHPNISFKEDDPNFDIANDGLIEFNDFVILIDSNHMDQESHQCHQEIQYNYNDQDQQKLIFAIPSESSPFLINLQDFTILPSIYQPPKNFQSFFKSKIIKHSKKLQNLPSSNSNDSNLSIWTIHLVSLTWTGQLWSRELTIVKKENNWLIEELDNRSSLMSDQFSDRDLDQLKILVNQTSRVLVWSPNQVWAFELADSNINPHTNNQSSHNINNPPEPSFNLILANDHILNLFFIGHSFLALITNKHFKLFIILDTQSSLLSPWSQLKLRPIHDASFTLPESRYFESVLDQSLFPQATHDHSDMINQIKLLTIDHDRSTGQRLLSELSFSLQNTPTQQEHFTPALDLSQSNLDRPVIHHDMRQVYSFQSIQNHFISSYSLTSSIWLEDLYSPTLLAGDSFGRLLIYAINTQLETAEEGPWKLERLIDEESLGGPICALYADQNWVLAGAMSGDLGIWQRQSSELESLSGNRIGDSKVALKLITRLTIGTVPIECFGRFPRVGGNGNGFTHRIARYISVMTNGSIIIWNIDSERNSAEVEDEICPEEPTDGVSELWSNGSELLVVYHEQRLRVYHWFSNQNLCVDITRQEAKKLITQAGNSWARVQLSTSPGNQELGQSSIVKAVGSTNIIGSANFNALSIRLRAFMKSIGLQDGTALAGRLWLVRLALSDLLPWGRDQTLDECAEKHLGIKLPLVEGDDLKMICGNKYERFGLTLMKRNVEERMRSGYDKTYRLLTAVVLLRVFLNEARYERHAGEMIERLSQMGCNKKNQEKLSSEQNVYIEVSGLDLGILVDYWLDSSVDIREGARLLFGARLGAMTDEEIEKVVSKWHFFLPIEEVKSDSSEPLVILGKKGRSDEAESRKEYDEKKKNVFKERKRQKNAILLIGLVVSERYKLLSTKVLKDLSIAVFQSISPTTKQNDNDERGVFGARLELLTAALEVCSKAFEIIQNYIDAIELVRNLFGWATGKSGEVSGELKGMAKHACLHVASVNTPLFMTTLSYDLIISRDANDRLSTMKLVVFMVRKRPLVLHGSLPRLVEAVVKSLDPTQKQMRAQTQTGATVVLHELVKTYPSIAFHGPSQRLGVGTPEGAMIIYDLKTATRISVLESYRRPVTACSFSEDGHRLVTVSLEEGRIEVWKVGGGLIQELISSGTGNFRAGVNQSINSILNLRRSEELMNINNKPYKSFPFNVGEEGMMSMNGTLEWVRIDWLGIRNCRLRIRESSITFSC